jgi:hypothetical protein
VKEPSSKEVAGKASDEPLVVAGTIGNLRAEVWQEGNPERKETFYSI